MLDVKTGSGAFMKTLKDSVTLAEKMVAIGTGAGRICTALITDMDVPLGMAIGNSLEVVEAAETLKGRGPADLREVSLRLAAEMLHTAGLGTAEAAYRLAEGTLEDGSAFETFKKMVRAQGGDDSFLEDTGRFAKAPFVFPVRAKEGGYVGHMDTEGCGTASVLLKAGRSKKEDAIDYSAGILLHKKYGDRVEPGDILAELLASEESLFPAASEKLLSSYTIVPEPPKQKKLIYARVTKDGVENFV